MHDMSQFNKIYNIQYKLNKLYIESWINGIADPEIFPDEVTLINN
jgi:hypothetical protein